MRAEVEALAHRPGYGEKACEEQIASKISKISDFLNNAVVIWSGVGISVDLI